VVYMLNQFEGICGACDEIIVDLLVRVSKDSL
jgi:hypothetical protein